MHRAKSMGRGAELPCSPSLPSPSNSRVHATEVCEGLASPAFSEVGHRVSCGLVGFKLNFSGGEDLISSKFV